MIKLSVIIPTFNRRHVLERTLAALLEQDLPPDEYEIIVINDGSTDDTAELLRAWKSKCAFRVLEAPHRGAGAARNVGIRAAVGKLVLFLDDDIIAIPDLLRQHCESHSDADTCVIQGRLCIAPGSVKTIIRNSIDRSYEDYYSHLDPALDVRFPDGMSSVYVMSFIVNSSMPRDILLRCGGFDEQILAAEDLELGLRLWKMGVSFRWRPTALAYELYVKSSWQYLRRQAWALGAGDLLAARKHPEYRPHSRLSAIAETRAPKRYLRSLLMRLPVSPAPLLALPLRVETWLYRFAPYRRMGMRLLRVAEVITCLRSALHATGSWSSLQNEFGRSCSGLLYHHVGPSRPNSYHALTVSPEQFERQIRWLARRGYVGIKPSDWLRWLHEGKDIPEKPILITFDDAYADTAEFALPILRRYGFSAAVFVVTERLGATNTWDETEGCGTLQLMTAEQIHSWSGQGIEFGAHSRTHKHLTQISVAESSAEIVGSKNDLVALLQAPVTSFAYPYGQVNDTIRDLVRAEFDLAFSVEEGRNYLSGDPHLLRRAYVGPNDSMSEFAVKVRRGGELKWFKNMRTKLALRTRIKKALKRFT